MNAKGETEKPEPHTGECICPSSKLFLWESKLKPSALQLSPLVRLPVALQLLKQLLQTHRITFVNMSCGSCTGAFTYTQCVLVCGSYSVVSSSSCS